MTFLALILLAIILAALAMLISYTTSSLSRANGYNSNALNIDELSDLELKEYALTGSNLDAVEAWQALKRRAYQDGIYAPEIREWTHWQIYYIRETVGDPSKAGIRELAIDQLQQSESHSLMIVDQIREIVESNLLNDPMNKHKIQILLESLDEKAAKGQSDEAPGLGATSNEKEIP